jgi:hypothetical protein
MFDGLGMAETTPGSLIMMVVQFVGFMAAFRAPGSLAIWFALHTIFPLCRRSMPSACRLKRLCYPSSTPGH